jgi:hypothetical protein
LAKRVLARYPVPSGTICQGRFLHYAVFRQAGNMKKRVATSAKLDLEVMGRFFSLYVSCPHRLIRDDGTITLFSCLERAFHKRPSMFFPRRHRGVSSRACRFLESGFIVIAEMR